jgi:D-lactate dehydrogenase
MTSHQAFFTKEAMENIACTTLENIKSFKDGAALKNEVHL